MMDGVITRSLAAGDRIANAMRRSPMQPLDVTEQIDSFLLRAPKVAKVLDISTAKAYQLMSAGELPTIRIGRALRVPRPALLAWVAEHTKPGAAA
jgi:excisionase family DNA binding protein